MPEKKGTDSDSDDSDYSQESLDTPPKNDIQQAIDNAVKPLQEELQKLHPLPQQLRKQQKQLQKLRKTLNAIQDKPNVHPNVKVEASTNTLRAATISPKHKAHISKALQTAYKQMYFVDACPTTFALDYQLFTFLRTLTPSMLQETTRKAVQTNNFRNFLLISYPDHFSEFEKIENDATQHIHAAEEDAYVDRQLDDLAKKLSAAYRRRASNPAGAAADTTSALASQPLPLSSTDFTEMIMY